MNLKVLLPSLIITITLLVVLASGFGNNPHEVPFVLEGEPARDFNLVSLDGKEVSLASLRGKPVVINFWSTWCGPCKVEHDILQIGSQKFPNVQFLGVVYQDTPEATKEYLATRRNFYPQLLDPNSYIAMDYGVAGVPETYIIAPNGTIAAKKAGVVTPEYLIEQLKPWSQR